MDAHLTIELVPRTCWYTNVRSQVPRAEWDAIRRAVYRRAGHVCEVCGGAGAKHPVECHEVWRYDDGQHIQRLERMVALCPACHRVKHIGKASVDGRYDEAAGHLAAVNGWMAAQAEQYVRACFRTWKRRSRHEWTLDIGILESERYRAWIARQLTAERGHHEHT